MLNEVKNENFFVESLPGLKLQGTMTCYQHSEKKRCFCEEAGGGYASAETIHYCTYAGLPALPSGQNRIDT